MHPNLRSLMSDVFTWQFYRGRRWEEGIGGGRVASSFSGKFMVLVGKRNLFSCINAMMWDKIDVTY